MKPLIREYMTECPQTISCGQPLFVAHQMMRAFGIRHLPVMDQGRLVGVVTERDLQMLESTGGVNQRATPVADAMTPFPFTVSADTPIEEVARTMAAHKYGSALVIDEGRVIGVFTATDAARALADTIAEVELPPTSNRWGHVIR